MLCHLRLYTIKKKRSCYVSLYRRKVFLPHTQSNETARVAGVCSLNRLIILRIFGIFCVSLRTVGT